MIEVGGEGERVFWADDDGYGDGLIARVYLEETGVNTVTGDCASYNMGVKMLTLAAARASCGELCDDLAMVASL